MTRAQFGVTLLVGSAVLLGIGAAVGFAAQSRPVIPPSRLRRRSTTLVVLGDSLAVGLAPYLQRWAEANGMEFRVDAKVGRSTPAQSTAAVVPGSLVFVSLGTNDAVGRTDGSALGRLAQAIWVAGADRVVWLVPPATKALPGLAAVRSAVAAAPVEAVTTNAPLRADGLHPSNYAIVVRDVISKL